MYIYAWLREPCLTSSLIPSIKFFFSNTALLLCYPGAVTKPYGNTWHIKSAPSLCQLKANPSLKNMKYKNRFKVKIIILIGEIRVLLIRYITIGSDSLIHWQPLHQCIYQMLCYVLQRLRRDLRARKAVSYLLGDTWLQLATIQLENFSRSATLSLNDAVSFPCLVIWSARSLC